MPSVEVLLHGESITTNYGSLGYCSTVLVRGDRTVIVDTGHVGRRRVLLAALDERGMRPSDVDVAVMTHAHWDHAQNYDVFPDAEVLIHEWERRYVRNPHDNDWATPRWTDAMLDSFADVREVEDGYEIEPGVRVLHTPGHSAGTMALIVQTAEGPVAITGDGVANARAAVTKVNSNVFWSEEDSRRSIERVLAAAEIVYPGHDRPFRMLRDGRIEHLAVRRLAFFGLNLEDPSVSVSAEPHTPLRDAGDRGPDPRSARLRGPRVRRRPARRQAPNAPTPQRVRDDRPAPLRSAEGFGGMRGSVGPPPPPPPVRCATARPTSPAVPGSRGIPPSPAEPPASAHHRREEPARHRVFEQLCALLREPRRNEGPAPEVQVQEPPEQHVVAEPFAELIVGAHRIEDDQQAGLQQVLGRHGRAVPGGVHVGEGPRQIPKRSVRQRSDAPDRVVPGIRSPGSRSNVTSTRSSGSPRMVASRLCCAQHTARRLPRILPVPPTRPRPRHAGGGGGGGGCW